MKVLIKLVFILISIVTDILFSCYALVIEFYSSIKDIFLRKN